MDIHFVIDAPLKMKELRIAESSNSAAMDLMSRFAQTEAGLPIKTEDFIAAVDEIELMEFAALWMEFNQALVPNRRGRT
ncbi:MAG: hypothetical protein IMZ61_07140 [Planctomycetes bacterium]|nr:hypothetical protein [Planctomycetota bacterium]